MKLELSVVLTGSEATIGELTVDGEYYCDTLEDVFRPEKIAGKTAIPRGTYKVILNRSPKFKRILPRLLDVPEFDGILIHKGNSAKDTAGCILVGYWDGKNPNWIANSTKAFDKLFPVMKAAFDRGEEITITLKDI